MDTMIAALLGGSSIGAVIGAVSAHFLASRKQATDSYAELVSRLEKRIDKLETDHQQCMKENADLREQIGKLKKVVEDSGFFLQEQLQ